MRPPRTVKMPAFLAALLILSAALACSSNPAQLTGTEWVLQQPGTETSGLARSEITVKFEPGGRVTGFYTYLSYAGTYTTEGDNLSISDICWLSLICQAATPLEAPQAFIETLSRASTFAISGDTLTIHADDEDLRFTRLS